MAKAFGELLSELETTTSDLAALLGDCNFDPKPAAKIVERLRKKPFCVLVLGEFSRGKSTFLNALVGEKVLPTMVKPTTAVISVLRSAPERKAVIHWRSSNDRPTPIELPTDKPHKALDRFVTTKNKQPEEIAKVEVLLPLDHLKLPIELVDTPGVNDIDTQREEITYGYLARADAAIMLLDIQAPLSASEKRFLTERVLENDIHKLFFVVNKVDQAQPAERERSLGYIRRNLEKIEGIAGSPIAPVSSKLALKGRQSRDAQQLEESLFPDFESRLLEFLFEASGQGRIRTSCRRLARIAERTEEAQAKVLAGLAGKQEELQAAIDEQEREFQQRTATAKQARGDAELAVGKFIEASNLAVRARVGQAQDAVKEIIGRDSFPSEEDTDELRTALNEVVRDVTGIPGQHSQDALLEVLRRHRGASTPKALVKYEGPEAELEMPEFGKEVVANMTATIGGAALVAGVATAVLGPVGLALGVLGGWIANEVTKPKPAEMEAKINKVLTGIAQESKNAVEAASRELYMGIRREVLVPLDQEASEAKITRDGLVGSLSEDLEARQRKARGAEQLRDRLQQIKERCLQIGGVT